MLGGTAEVGRARQRLRKGEEMPGTGWRKPQSEAAHGPALGVGLLLSPAEDLRLLGG